MSTQLGNLAPSRPLGKQQALSGGRLATPNGLDSGIKLKLKIICDHSEELPLKYFSNKVDGKDLNTLIRSQINELLKKNDIELNSSDLPIKIDGFLEKNRSDPSRIDKILNLYNVKFEEDIIAKCIFKGEIEQKTKGNMLRIFVKFDNRIVNVLLIDPHHLVATEDYIKIYKERKCKCRYCLSFLKNISIMD